jgi:hypothetical protein
LVIDKKESVNRYYARLDKLNLECNLPNEAYLDQLNAVIEQLNTADSTYEELVLDLDKLSLCESSEDDLKNLLTNIAQNKKLKTLALTFINLKVKKIGKLVIADICTEIIIDFLSQLPNLISLDFSADSFTCKSVVPKLSNNLKSLSIHCMFTDTLIPMEAFFGSLAASAVASLTHLTLKSDIKIQDTECLILLNWIARES